MCGHEFWAMLYISLHDRDDPSGDPSGDLVRYGTGTVFQNIFSRKSEVQL